MPTNEMDLKRYTHEQNNNNNNKKRTILEHNQHQQKLNYPINHIQ